MFQSCIYFTLILLISCVIVSICDWVEIPQVTSKNRDQNPQLITTSSNPSPSDLHRKYTNGNSFQNYQKNSYQYRNSEILNTLKKNSQQNGNLGGGYALSTQIGRPEVTTEHWSTDTEDEAMSLGDLVNDALYNLKNPIVTTEQSSRITMYTTQVPPLPTIPTTRQEEVTGSDDLEETDDNEYYDDETYVTTAMDENDTEDSSVSSSSGDDFNVNKILSNDKESTTDATSNKRRMNAEKIKVEKGEDDNIQSSLFSMAGFLPLLKDIQETLTKNNEKQTTSSKVELLQNIRDQLLTNINYRMNALWGDGNGRRQPTHGISDDGGMIHRERRDARTFKDKAHDDLHHDHHYEEHETEHHVDFPSNAAALLALSFLTFAVFLIKLVLQVIQALQAKAQNMTTTTTSATIIRLRRSEDEEYENAAKILNYIDTYPLK